MAGEPMSGITKNGRTNVATSEPPVFTASSVPVADPSVPCSSPRRAAVAGNTMPIAMVVGRTMMADDVAKSRSAFMNSGEDPLNGDCGEARTPAPMTTKTVVTSWATAISRVVGRTRGRSQPTSAAPIAMPTRNSTRMIVNT